MFTYQPLAKTAFLSTGMIIISTILVGCATVVSGHQQPVSVQTGSVTRASCSLTNDKGTWQIPSTPGSVVVNQSYNDMLVKCHKAGFPTMTQSVKSTTKPIVFGNLLIGGALGASYDMSTGAAYNYPSIINVRMS